MYESYYALREKPFSLLPDPGFLYPSPKHEMAMALLEYGLMNQAGFAVLSGNIGTGKTTIVRHLLNRLEKNLSVGLITNTHRSLGELLHWVLMAFNLPTAGKTKVEMYQAFVDFLIAEYGRNRRTLLIVDEAQNLPAETLEELRMLSNINADKDQILQIFLVGQPGLRDLLRRPDLEQFAQRIVADYHLESLSAPETTGYIRHRIGVADGDPAIFEEAACEAVFRHSGGTPRLINVLCDTALVYGFAEQSPRITARLIEDVAREKRRNGIFPGARPTGDEPTAGARKKKLQVALVSTVESRITHLRAALEESGMQVAAAVLVGDRSIAMEDLGAPDLLFVDIDVRHERRHPQLRDVLQQRDVPVLLNDNAHASSTDDAPHELRRRITLKLASLIGG